VSWNCLDVHLEERGHKTALTFVGEPGDVRHVSYRELHADVCRFANGLLSLGVKQVQRFASGHGCRPSKGRRARGP
jgi:acetyl-CoA synthetase